MSALKQVFVRVHIRYEQDRYAEDLERFAAWLLGSGYPNKTARTHLFRVQQVLHAIGAAPSIALRADVLGRAFARVARRRWTRCYASSTYAGYLRSSGRLIEPPRARDPLASLVEDFCGGLVRQRGLAPGTVTEYRHSVSHFLQQMLQPVVDLIDHSFSKPSN